MQRKKISIAWLRRDLRLHDQAALYHALRGNTPVLPLFIYDRQILSRLQDPDDARLSFIHDALAELQKELRALGSSLLVKHDEPLQAWKEIVKEFDVEAVYINHDYEPQARQRDESIRLFLQEHGIPLYTYKDQCIFEKDEILKDDGKPYTVFTPYSRKWRARLNDFYLKPYPNQKYFHNFLQIDALPQFSLEQIGFKRSKLIFPPGQSSEQVIRQYAARRDFPALPGSSRLSVHFRFGTISIREKARKAMPLSDTWINELIWRDFYMQILWHFPYVAESAFKPAYRHIAWRNNEEEFERWCQGQTGYPIVDAGMRELNNTGFMHNRVRMIVASFLSKHLLIDWRWGEAYFARKLLDFDLSANNGGWQWAAGCGTDAAPYFRVFNPALQTQKFDKDYVYIKKWVPEWKNAEYVKPIVQHELARKRCLDTYKEALGSAN